MAFSSVLIESAPNSFFLNPPTALDGTRRARKPPFADWANLITFSYNNVDIVFRCLPIFDPPPTHFTALQAESGANRQFSSTSELLN
ncbi:hypothetical protein Agabi119p4_7979 [Agaricus bisporus var. burnettii]|uniref:Uncharacterized protein n=1 Tax=Agaricus bisporus var. burnettii TaxID=192524 RepID=A0A8H7C5U6_AGABI|nr:hypothetical protein Agabi119p4_7979 [Agaricus bisporus var. burnettii]